MKFDIYGCLAKMPAVKSYKQPLFEAVANSIQSIQLRRASSSGNHFTGCIKVYVEFEPLSQEKDLFESGTLSGGIIKSFRVVDNGEGFHDKNFESFDTIDTTYKKQKFACRGEGRFLWLKAFSEVQIESRYLQDGSFYHRSFLFCESSNPVKEIEKPKEDNDCSDAETTVLLKRIKDVAVNKRRIGIDEIADALLSHFLLYLIQENAPNIFVIDDVSKEKINVNLKLKSYLLEEPTENEREVCGQIFKLIGQKFKSTVVGPKISGVYWSAGDRLVENIKISDYVEEVSETLVDADGEVFEYIGVVKSPFLDERVNSERTKIIFPTEIEFSEESNCPSEDKIKRAVGDMVRTQLSDSLSVVRKKGRDKIHSYVQKEGPEFREFVNAKKDLYISPSSKERQVRDYLIREYANYEIENNRKIDELLDIQWDSKVDPKTEIKKIQDAVSPVNAYNLAKFASSRKFYVEMLDKVCRYKDDADGEHYLEEALHSLIYPMQKDSTEVGQMHNLWLLNENLSFHYYVASDLSFRENKAIDSSSECAPDLFLLNVFGDYDVKKEEHVGELVLVEFKRPGRKSYGRNEDPIRQMFDYVQEIKENKLKLDDSIKVNVSHCPIYYYLIADLEPSLVKLCCNYGLLPTLEGERYYGYNRDGVFIEVMSLSALRKGVKQRHRALWQAAGLR